MASTVTPHHALRAQAKGGSNLMNPLDPLTKTITSTIVSGIVLAIILVFVVKAIVGA